MIKLFLFILHYNNIHLADNNCVGVPSLFTSNNPLNKSLEYLSNTLINKNKNNTFIYLFSILFIRLFLSFSSVNKDIILLVLLLLVINLIY